jgi:hypothetical protein
MSRVLAGAFNETGSIRSSSRQSQKTFSLLDALDGLSPEQRDVMARLIREFGRTSVNRGAVSRIERATLAFLCSPAVLDWFTVKAIASAREHRGDRRVRACARRQTEEPASTRTCGDGSQPQRRTPQAVRLCNQNKGARKWDRNNQNNARLMSQILQRLASFADWVNTSKEPERETCRYSTKALVRYRAR